MAKEREDIPRSDDNFYNFMKTLMKNLEKVTEMGGVTQENWKHWLIPEAKFKRLKDLWNEYQPLYDKAQGKTSRDQGDVAAHRKKREKDLEPYLREFIKQYIRYEDQIPDDEKTRMGIIIKDTEPSPVHGSHLVTLAPFVGQTNMGGSVIDNQYKRKSDKDRPSVPKGYGCELRWWALEKTDPDPADPNTPGYTVEISSKARFQVTAGMSNLGKKFKSFARWRHKTNSSLHSPWTNLMQITIS